MEKAFPRLHVDEVELEKTIEISGHRPGAIVRYGFADAVYGDLVFEFKRILDSSSVSKGESELSKYLIALPLSEQRFGLLTDGETVRVYAIRDRELQHLDTFTFARDIALRFGVRSPVFGASLRSLEIWWKCIECP